MQKVGSFANGLIHSSGTMPERDGRERMWMETAKPVEEISR